MIILLLSPNSFKVISLHNAYNIDTKQIVNDIFYSFFCNHSWNNKLVSWHQDISIHLDSHLQNLCQFCIEITDCCQVKASTLGYFLTLTECCYLPKYFPFQQVRFFTPPLSISLLINLVHATYNSTQVFTIL